MPRLSPRADPPSIGDGPALNGPLDIEVTDEKNCEARYDIVKTMRASICVLGPLLAKRGKAIVSIPGGCAIGDRPVDLHVRGLQKLGAEFHTENGNIVGEVRGPAQRLPDVPRRGAGPDGSGHDQRHVRRGAGRRRDGARRRRLRAGSRRLRRPAQSRWARRSRGHGTPEIRIEGVEKLTGVEHRIIPDRIECGTFMIAAAITNGELELKHCNLDHLIAVRDRLDEVGVKIERENGTIFVSSARRLNAGRDDHAAVSPASRPICRRSSWRCFASATA